MSDDLLEAIISAAQVGDRGDTKVIVAFCAPCDGLKLTAIDKYNRKTERVLSWTQLRSLRYPNDALHYIVTSLQAQLD